MIPALALAVPLLRSVGLRCAAHSQPSPLTRARSLAPRAVLPEAAPELPAQEPHDSVSKPGRNRATRASAGHPGLRLIGQRFPAAPAEASNAEPDPEVRGIEAALRRIEQDPRARQQFYADVDSVITSVRSDRPIPPTLMLEHQLPLPLRPATAFSGPPGLSAPRVEEESVPSPPDAGLAPPPRGPDSGVRSPDLDIRPVLSPNHSPLDPAVVSRVVYWAQVNGCPVQLALATAWQESRMTLRPARGASGEIGIMQIMPERARLEGVDPASLDDPETNIRLGTKLLARYYSEEGSVARAAMKYVAGPGVFEKHYAPDVRDYISWYSASVDNFAQYFGRYVNF
jgi:soluble lytic murein transglycosylase-like protein